MALHQGFVNREFCQVIRPRRGFGEFLAITEARVGVAWYTGRW